MRAFLLVFLVGCGSGGGDKLSSIGAEKKLSALPAAEMKQLCEDMKVYKAKHKVSDEDNIKITCNAQAIISVARSEAKDDAALRAECKKAHEACIAKNAKLPDAMDLDCNDTKFSGEMGRCDATVGELTECVADMNIVLKKFAADDACAILQVGDKAGVRTFFDKMKSPKCDAMETKCKAKPSGKDGDSAALAKEALGRVEALRDQMCACTDKDCATKVSDAMTKWSAEMEAKVDKHKPDLETAKKISEGITKFTACMAKLLEGTPAAKP